MHQFTEKSWRNSSLEVARGAWRGIKLVCRPVKHSSTIPPLHSRTPSQFVDQLNILYSQYSKRNDFVQLDDVIGEARQLPPFLCISHWKYQRRRCSYHWRSSKAPSCVFLIGNVGRRCQGSVQRFESSLLCISHWKDQRRRRSYHCRSSKASSCVFLIENIRRGGAVITWEVRQLPPVYFLLEISEEEVRGLFKNLHSRHAAGSDEIHPRLLTHLYPPSHIQDT